MVAYGMEVKLRGAASHSLYGIITFQLFNYTFNVDF